MQPILLQLEIGAASITLHSYGTFMMLAWIMGVGVAALTARVLGLSWKRSLAVFGTSLAAGVLGARIFDLWIAGDYYAEDPSRLLESSFRGFSLYGGLLVACLTAIVLARLLRLPVWRLADASIPGITTGIVLMRTGCLLNGCCFGTPTGLPWGIRYPEGSAAWAHQFVTGDTGLLAVMGVVEPVHPTQVYEDLGAVALCAVALWLMKRTARDGVAFLAFAAGFTGVRLVNGFFRARQVWITAPEWFYPAFYLLIIAVLGLMLVWRARSPGDVQRHA